MFPDDGHPDLAAYVANLTGDARDEVVLWDQERVWIYTQDRPFSGERVYAPAAIPTTTSRTTARWSRGRDGPGRVRGAPTLRRRVEAASRQDVAR